MCATEVLVCSFSTKDSHENESRWIKHQIKPEKTVKQQRQNNNAKTISIK